MTYHVGDVYEQGCQFGCGFCDKKFFQKIMEEEEVSDGIGILGGMETENNIWIMWRVHEVKRIKSEPAAWC